MELLIVEDEPEIREMLRQWVEMDGFLVTCAANGKEALDLLADLLAKDSPLPALILLDLMMPVMNGWEFAQAIQKVPRLAAIPIAIISAYPEHHQSGLVQVGARISQYISKPIDLELLSKVILQCTSPKNAETENGNTAHAV